MYSILAVKVQIYFNKEMYSCTCLKNRGHCDEKDHKYAFGLQD